MEYKDLAGQEIKVGDFVVYTALWSRSAVMKYGKVVELGIRKDKYDENKPGEPTLKIISADRGFIFNPLTKDHDNAWIIQAQGKKITLGFLDRTLVISPAQMPKEVYQLLSLN